MSGNRSRGGLGDFALETGPRFRAKRQKKRAQFWGLITPGTGKFLL